MLSSSGRAPPPRNRWTSPCPTAPRCCRSSSRTTAAGARSAAKRPRRPRGPRPSRRRTRAPLPGRAPHARHRPQGRSLRRRDHLSDTRGARRWRSRGDARRPSPVTVRYRFSALVEDTHGRLRLRFPPSPEATPLPAEVSVVGPGLGDLEIAGVHTALPGHASAGGGVTLATTAPAAADANRRRRTSRPVRAGRSRTRWRRRRSPAPPPRTGRCWRARPRSPRSRRANRRSRSRCARARAVRPRRRQNVLFVIDRSRSVGLAGLAAEHDVATHLLDLLAPTTRFDVLFFDRTLTRLFPMARTATRDATGSIEAEMVPDRLANGTDLEGALRAAGEMLRREASSFGPRALLAVITDGALPETIDRRAARRCARRGPRARARAWRRSSCAPATTIRSRRRRARRWRRWPRRAAASSASCAPTTSTRPARRWSRWWPRAATSSRRAWRSTRPARGCPARCRRAAGFTGVVRVPGKLRKGADIAGVTRGRSMRAPLKPIAVDAAWLRPHAAIRAVGAGGARPDHADAGRAGRAGRRTRRRPRRRRRCAARWIATSSATRCRWRSCRARAPATRAGPGTTRGDARSDRPRAHGDRSGARRGHGRARRVVDAGTADHRDLPARRAPSRSRSRAPTTTTSR